MGKWIQMDKAQPSATGTWQQDKFGKMKAENILQTL